MDKIRIRGTYVGIEMSFFKANNGILRVILYLKLILFSG